MPAPSKATEIIKGIEEELSNTKTQAQAIKLFNRFLESIFVSCEIYKPQTLKSKTWENWVKSVKKLIKGKFPSIKFSQVWWNKRELRNDDGEWLDDAFIAQKLREYCTQQNSALAKRIWGSDVVQVEAKPEPARKASENKPSAIDEAMASETVQASMKRSGMDSEQFILAAIHAYAKENQDRTEELSQIPTAELKGRKKPGYGEHLCERAVKVIIAHNQETKNTDARYQITYPVIKALTNCSTSVMERVLGNPTKGVQGTMRDEINEHHESLGMISKVYNRGKDPVTDYIRL